MEIAVAQLRVMSHMPVLLLLTLLDELLDELLLLAEAPPLPMSPPTPPVPVITHAVKLAVPKQAAVIVPKTTAKVRVFIR
jgi:hypothetical protein